MTGEWKLPPLQPVTAAAQADSAAGGGAVPVTVDNFVRAESDLYFAGLLRDSGAIGKFVHRREPASIDNQTVIRLNRDTLYSSALFDLDAGPVDDHAARCGQAFHVDAGHQRRSLRSGSDLRQGQLHADQGKGRHALCRGRDPDAGRSGQPGGHRAGPRAAGCDQGQPEGYRQLRRCRIGIRSSQKKVRDALLVLASTIPDFKKAFGTKDEVDPVRHLIGTAAAWGGNPDKDATYLNVTPAKNDGSTDLQAQRQGRAGRRVLVGQRLQRRRLLREEPLQRLHAQQSDREEETPTARSRSSSAAATARCRTACRSQRAGTTPVRLYRPRAEILNGRWKFPEPRPVS